MNQEEKRQRLIVRQSQMERVIEYCQLMNIQPEASDLMAMVDVFTSSIFEEPNYMSRTKKMDEHLQKEYKG
jgi:hypothetical protein